MFLIWKNAGTPVLVFEGCSLQRSMHDTRAGCVLPVARAMHHLIESDCSEQADAPARLQHLVLLGGDVIADIIVQKVLALDA